MNSGVGSFQLSFTSHKNQISESAVRWDSLQCMVFGPYLRRLESITVCRSMSLQRQYFLLSSLIKDPECWSSWGLNLPHHTKQTNTLPTELTRQQWWHLLFYSQAYW